ncbi:FAD-binding oxidoreductase [Novosphingobium sp. P6W]|uniref:FAD-binding oxidoreductase n=1 Tax=Novosphingobium sp. P6W TaxID=1609758 RepID=UPI0005C2E104|nr:FAD-linked oxidase C-terminal domain-containing protein [Novosphingobium sp. P6W]AXB78829.1 FAD-binding protein [Novosphingobium sp. P6W]KIS29900.1 lactate dehydrogenase [Novosphingobium sp. P6W]
MNNSPNTGTVQGLPDQARTALDHRLGDRVSYSRTICSQHGKSESHFPDYLPDAVVFPQSTEEVVFVVRLCTEYQIKLTAFGAGTSMEGNALPIEGGISLDMSRMDRVLTVNSEDFDVTVEAGVTRVALNNYLRDAGLFFPVDPGADATIGGMASTRASGTNAVRYGTMREAVLSLRVVTADGRDIRTARRARKSAAGYDLTRLFVGAEGTLGIITEVTLRLHPIPEVISAAVCGFETIEGAAMTVIQAIQLGVPLARVEILDDKQMHAVNLWSKTSYPEITTLFFEFHGSQASVDEQVATVRELAEANGGGSFDWSSLPEERSRLWKARHEAYWATTGLRPGSVGWATDVCVPIGRLAECISATKLDLVSCSLPATICGHVGDGNFHVCFALDPHSSDERKEVEEINKRLLARALAMDGTCTGEHGIGLGKQTALIDELGEGVDVMRQIKHALDPAGIFNPGKIFSPS